MATLKLPANLRKKTLASGRTAYYWEVPTKDSRAGCPLPNEALGPDPLAAIPRATALNDLLAAWRGGQVQPAGPAVGTVEWLFAKYEKSLEFRRLAPATQRQYRSAFHLLNDLPLTSGRPFGTVPAEKVRVSHMKRIYEQLQTVIDIDPTTGAAVPRRRLATANATMRAAAAAWRVILSEEVLPDLRDPFGFRLTRRGLNKRTKAVTREQLDTFIAEADAMGVPSMGTAALLAFELCQRQVDIISSRLVDDEPTGLVWAHYRSPEEVGRRAQIEILQSKTEERVTIPLFDSDGELIPGLIGRLAQTPRRGSQIVMRDTLDRSTKTYLPYNADWFRHLFRKIADAADLPRWVKFKALRHGGLTELGSAESTDQELMAVGGHQTREMLSRYTNTSAQQARNAVRRRRALRLELDDIKKMLENPDNGDDAAEA
ncbi:hypothetical protein C882_2294 [Caenispirillum salinarum AK4]|uniref:Tyr recombinase domain-containing protein n=1 Tax=Caenispirillum salinarum AK4 TaxID=1238182 RepID=K9GNB9_9PROT|nr:tyrosine-type recombinase/integrase [Caenispirillum salinarum]EKV26582.1 hypothetical protein C882_2294 [Caenispirillum salinarum AK4]